MSRTCTDSHASAPWNWAWICGLLIYHIWSFGLIGLGAMYVWLLRQGIDPASALNWILELSVSFVVGAVAGIPAFTPVVVIAHRSGPMLRVALAMVLMHLAGAIAALCTVVVIPVSWSPAVLALPSVVVATVIGILMARTARSGRRVTPVDHCSRCGYDTHGTHATRCSECGSELHGEQ